jgi:hypothetical protein
LSLSKSAERTPERYGETLRLPTIPSSPSEAQAPITSSTGSSNDPTVARSGPATSRPSRSGRRSAYGSPVVGPSPSQPVERDERQPASVREALTAARHCPATR